MPLKILLADDSLTAQNMGKKILADAGYEVIAVSNGAQAMKRIASDKPDLVVLDVYMPGYTGVEVCERMRNSRETARTPVVLSVGKMEAFKPEEGTRVRADGLIVKPFEATELLAVVKKLAETLSPAPRPKRQPEPESVPERVEATTAAAEPELESQRQSVEVPQDIASTPVIGMELIPEEAQEPPAPIEFEVESDPAPAELDAGPRMSSAAGLSGVFEMQPSAAPAVATPAAPQPQEEFERFAAPPDAPPQAWQAHEPAAGLGATTVEHEFDAAAPPASSGEAEFAPHAESASETWSAPPANTSHAEYTVERFDQAQPGTSVESPVMQTPQGLPELAAWDEPAAALPVETPHLSTDPVLNGSAVEFPAAGSVWVAEEAEVEPYESVVSLHQQMQREAREALEAETVASPAGGAESAVHSQEIPEPFQAERYQPGAGPSTFHESNLPEFAPSALADPFDQPAPQSAYPGTGSDPDSPPGDMPTSEAQSAAAPAPAPELEHSAAAAASQLAPQIIAPTVTEVPVDPARIAGIVDQVLERLKPELIAAVTRELEKKSE